MWAHCWEFPGPVGQVRGLLPATCLGADFPFLERRVRTWPTYLPGQGEAADGRRVSGDRTPCQGPTPVQVPAHILRRAPPPATSGLGEIWSLTPFLATSGCISEAGQLFLRRDFIASAAGSSAVC